LGHRRFTDFSSRPRGKHFWVKNAGRLGGLQEETTALGIPCLTLRENTERPITVEMGTNTVAGNKKKDILNCYRQIVENGKPGSAIPPKWDGKAAERIVDVLMVV